MRLFKVLFISITFIIASCSKTPEDTVKKYLNANTVETRFGGKQNKSSIETLKISDPIIINNLQKSPEQAKRILMDTGIDYSPKKLINSIRDGNNNLASLLIISGIDLNTTYEPYRCYALTEAIYKKNYDIINLLIRHGADVNITPIGSNGPLHLAIKYKNTLILKFLLDHGANPNIKNKVNFSYRPQLRPLDLVDLDIRKFEWVTEEKIQNRINDFYRIVNLLIESGARIDSAYYKGSNLIHGATMVNDYSMVSSLLKMGGNFNNIRILKSAMFIDDKRIFKLFLDNGADTELLDDSGDLLIDHAIRRKDIDALKILLKHGANPNILKNKMCQSPLNLAILASSDEDIQVYISIINMLIDYKADVNLADCRNGTPLALSVSYRSGCVEIIKLLLESGADPNLRSKNDNLSIEKITRKFGDDQYIQILKLLLDYGANPNIKFGSRGGNTPLIHATQENKYNEVKLLLDYGTKVGEKNKEGKTAYYYALEKGYNDIASLLEEIIQK